MYKVHCKPQNIVEVYIIAQDKYKSFCKKKKYYY
jgi:hypothetical protein